MFLAKYKNYISGDVVGKSWIQIYMEKHLSDYLEGFKPNDYHPDKIKQTIELCSPYVNQLKVTHLQPSMNSNDSGRIENPTENPA